MQLAGYIRDEVIYAAGETVVATATTASGERVVLKYIDSEHPPPELLARWRHEYAMLSLIDSPLVIKARGLVPMDRSEILVLEDFAASSLSQLIQRAQLDLSDQLSLAIQLARAVGAVHEHRLIHGDIAPKNVLVDPESLAIKLCDFGLSTRLDIQPRRADGGAMAGTLEYMSPEQTGRTNLDVDYRSDFYSLGASLYELFGGREPFVASDPMSLLHAQLASMPVPLHELDRAIPEALSAIVQKLLAKHPDDRYQSSFGLIRDLEACADSWRLYQRIERFPPGRVDVPERFFLSQKLYGRQAECASILSAFKRVVGAGSVELLLISGYSGIGKTALVSELHRPVLSRRGYLLRGKCDQYSRNQPYTALIQAFGQMLQALASEGAERRRYWKGRLTEAIGANAAALVEIIPALAMLIGSVPPLPELPPAESEQRFHIAFGQLVVALAARSHPLLVFLDDLQWADVSTLRLLEYLVRAEGERSVLIVGAYRDNEVQEGDPLQLSLQAIERSQTRVEHLRLGPMADADVRQLIADTLHATPEAVTTMAALCIEKTRGNPFFLGQFLRRLVDQGDIAYDREHGAWVWDLERIRGRGMTDNVVSLLLATLTTLPEPTQALLARAAHLGNRFDQRELMAMGERDAEATAEVLWPALQSGLLVPLNEEYKFAQSPERLKGARYRFLHDRVQEAAHELIDESDRPALRLRCGRLLLAASSEAELEERLFVILESFNAARELIDDPGERKRLLALNLQGGIRAKSASAFDAAVALLRHAEALLPADAWNAQPELALSLHKNLAEAEYLAGHFERAESRLTHLIEIAPGVTARATLCLAQAYQMQIRGRFDEAFVVLRSALALLGREFPATEAEATALFPQEFAETDALLASRDEREMLAQAEMSDPERLLEMQVYYGLAYTTYQINRGVSYVLGACRMVKTTLLHGLCDISCIGYLTLPTAMAAVGKPYPLVYTMGRLARRLAEQRDNPYFRLSVYQYFAAFYQHWGEPLRDTLPLLEEGQAMGRAGINPLAAGYCALLRPVNGFVMGAPLEDVELEAEQGLAFLKRSRQPVTEAMLRCGVLQPLAALRGKTLKPQSFDTHEQRIGSLLGNDFETPSICLAFYCFAMTRHAYLFDAAADWRSCSARLAMIGQLLPDGPTLVETSFFRALGLLKPGFIDADALPDAIAEAQAIASRFDVWANDCPSNFLHKALLLAAEVARMRNEPRAAMELYARAIEAATDSGFAHCEALCNELYARYWLEQQQRQLASNFIREAYYHYQRWGAAAKCKQIEAQWPHIVFRAVELRRSTSSSSGNYGGVSSSVGMLDLQTLLKASRLLSQEVQLEALLQKLLGIALENAGAEFGAIVLCDEDSLQVEALGRFGEGVMMEYERVARAGDDDLRDTSRKLPLELIEYAQLTRSLQVLNNPAEDIRFAHSAYLAERRPKSVLVLPVLNQGRLVAIIYVENNLLEGAFTERHVKTLELLGAQAAISLVNARHVENLERKVAERTEELRRMSMKDGLTGIANRRSFDDRLASEWRRGLRTGKALSLMMIDIDHFKLFNDHYGHVEGDRCIRAVAKALEQGVGRSTDLVARYGGEEFSVILPDTDHDSARWLADSCLQAIAALAIPHAQSTSSAWVSISIGVRTLVVDAETGSEQLVTGADQALYAAKRAGRNCYRVWLADTATVA
ncbi:MAG: diguanylate cyclase domain-containing protein [Pseudomarimonas sp.]